MASYYSVKMLLYFFKFASKNVVGFTSHIFFAVVFYFNNNYLAVAVTVNETAALLSDKSDQPSAV